MNSVMGFAVMFLIGLVAVNGGLLGGEQNVDDSDKETVGKATHMIEEFMKNEYEKEENGYKTSLSFSEMDVKRQLVAGLLYNFKWTTTFKHACVNDPKSNKLCQQKDPVTKNCSASVWQKLGENAELVFADGKEPKCE